MSQPQIYGLIGYPVTHSFSACMHNAAFQHLKINAEYRLFELEAQELKDFLKSLSQKNIYGLNVTVPYKEKVIPFLNNVSAEAKLIGAVNTIRSVGGTLDGFNTDGEGFLKHLTTDLKFDPQGKTIALIGAGGAARAVAVYLSKNRAGKIAIYDIDKNKLSALLAHLKLNFNNIEFIEAGSIEELDIKNSGLLINATPIGMKQNDPCLAAAEFMHQGLLVYDLIYNPPETQLLKVAKESGAKVSNGLGMLLYQGALSFQIWTGKPAPVEIMRQALKEGVKKI